MTKQTDLIVTVSIPDATEQQFDAMCADLRAGGNAAVVEPWGGDNVVILTDAMMPRVHAIAIGLGIKTFAASLDASGKALPVAVESPPADRKLGDASQLDWTAARAAGLRVVRICEDAGFVAPEALDLLQSKIALICEQMNVIVAALCIRGPGKR